MAEWTINNNVLSITGAEGVLGTGDNNALAIETNGKECLWVDPNGSVGVGTADPVATLDIAGGTLHINEPASDPTAIETPVQGAYIAWNALNGSTGETDFINNQGGGGGGFAFMNTSGSENSRTIVMFIDGEGNVKITGNLLVAKPDEPGQFGNVGEILWPPTVTGSG
jgi:hypothetical protein